MEMYYFGKNNVSYILFTSYLPFPFLASLDKQNSFADRESFQVQDSLKSNAMSQNVFLIVGKQQLFLLLYVCSN